MNRLGQPAVVIRLDSELAQAHRLWLDQLRAWDLWPRRAGRGELVNLDAYRQRRPGPR